MTDLQSASDQPTRADVSLIAASDRLLLMLIAEMGRAAAIDDPEMRRAAIGHLQQSCRSLSDAYGLIACVAPAAPPATA